jgi:NADPH:quinone reductase-like Zn-dependent oxidoreductase
MTDIPNTMTAALLTGHGGLDMIEVRDDVALPQPGPGEVLIRVSACGMNNTDINTRTAWYSKTVTEATTGEEFDEVTEDAATWGGAAITFPRIQGADVCGRVVAVGSNADANHIGNRVMIDPWIRDQNDAGNFDKARYLGSEIDGGYAQYIKIPESNVFPIDSDLPDEALASFACSYQTAENMLTRARLSDGETIVISGASGGVGSALIQLSKRRGAHVIAIAGKSKLEDVRAVGADAVIDRNEQDLMSAVLDRAPSGQVDVAADVVGGETFDVMVNCLKRGGRYVIAGAIGGPIVEVDLRTLYLHDLELIGATICPPEIFKNLVGYIERGEIRPLVAKTFPLQHIRQAQNEFIKKQHVGNFVITI